MERKALVWLGITVGSLLGGLVPALFGQGLTSPAALLFSLVGAGAGAWVAVRYADSY